MLFNELSHVLDVLGVELVVGESQLQVVRAPFEDLNEDISVPRDIVGQADGPPWVEIPVGEHDLGDVQEVLVGVAASERVESPVELRCHVVGALAVSDEVIGYPGSTVEHVRRAVLSDGHHHLVAHLVVPAVVVEATLGGAGAYIHALKGAGGVLEDVKHDLENLDVVEVALHGSSDVALSPGAGSLDWVGGE